MKKLLTIVVFVLIFALCLTACKPTPDDSSTSLNSSETSINASTEGNSSTVNGGSSENQSITSVGYNQTGTPESSALDLVSLEFDTSTAKVIFAMGAPISYSQVSAKIVLNDTNQTKLTLKANKLNFETDYDPTKPGEYTVTVSYPRFPSVSYKVTVMDIPKVENGEVKFIIDPNCSDNYGKLVGGALYCKTISQALALIVDAQYDASVIKTVKLAEGKFVEKLSISQKNVHFIAEDASKTIISYGDCSGKVGGTDASSSVTVAGEGFLAKNITFENSFDYNGDKQYGDNKQATAVLVDADKVYFENCVFLGYQDTLQAKRGRQYYKNCTIKGCVDYIFGNNATALFDNCDIVTLKRADNEEYCITAHKGNNGDSGSGATQIPTYGYVFMNCRLTCEQGVTVSSTALGRPWRADATVAYINCEMGEHISTYAYGTKDKVSRYRSMSVSGATNIPENAHFYEFGNTGLGAVSTQLNNDFTMLTNADNYTVSNIFATTNGAVTYTGEWNPVA